MLEGLLTYINSQNLFAKNEKIILAISGGMDSMVLCELFVKAKFEFAIAHVNFGLRGEESEADEVFVKKLALKHKVLFFTTTFETESYAKENNISIQMAARILRYKWFEQIRIKNSYQYIATAHHQNDSAETILLNMAKGTGMAGLHGILPKRGSLIRPLLFASKDMIMDYLVENQIIWREDSSNESQKYQRNYIRQEIIPRLKEINPNFEETIQRTINKVKDLELFFFDELVKFKETNLKIRNGVYFLSFLQLNENGNLKALFIAVFSEFNFNYSQAEEIISSINSEAGKTFISISHTLVRDRSEFVIKENGDIQNFGTQEIELDFTKSLELEIQKSRLLFSPKEITADFKLKTAKKTATLDFDTLKSPLKIRKWKDGDWFCPLGMNKKKNLSDFLNAEKIPLNLKKDVFVITSNGSIVWVVGFRIDNRFKISEKTTKGLIIDLI